MEGLEVAGHRQAYQVLLPANHLIVNCVLLILDFNFMPLEVTVCFFDNLPQTKCKVTFSDPAFYALSHSSKHFLHHGSSNNRLFQRF